MKNWFLKRPRLWGMVCILLAAVGSNVGSAWAGAAYGRMAASEPWMHSAPATVGFMIMAWTVYPACLLLLGLGLYLWSRRR